MADFETQVKALTGITLGAATTPINTDLDQFLVDGVLEVTNKWLALRGGDRPAFTRKWTSGLSGVEKIAAGTASANSTFSGGGNWAIHEAGGSSTTTINVAGGVATVDPGGDGTYEGIKLPATNIYPTGGNPWVIGSIYRIKAKLNTASADAGPITFGLGGSTVIPTNLSTGDTSGTIVGTQYTYQADITASATSGDALIYIASPSDGDTFVVDDVTIEELNVSPQVTPSNLISVQRESGTSGDWRECRTVPIGVQSRITDSDSLFYASQYNPAFTFDDAGNLLVFPLSDNEAGNRYQAYYINNYPVAKDLTALVRGDSDVSFFPDDKVHLVIKYAAMQVLISAFTALVSDVDTIPNIMIDHDGDDSFAEAESTSTQDLTKFNVNSWSAVDYDFDSQNLDVTRWFQVAGDMIQRQEDIDLANAQMTKIQQYLSAYQATAEVKTQRIQARMKDYIQRYDWIAGSYNDYFRTEAEMQSRQDKQREQAQERRSE